MMKRIMLFGILASLIQLVFYSIMTLILWHSIDVFYKFKDDWKSFIVLSVPLFGVLIFFQNILIEIINKKWNVIFLFLFILIIYLIGWGEDLDSWPTKTVLILTTGTITLVLKFIFDLNLKNLKLSVVQKLITHNS